MDQIQVWEKGTGFQPWVLHLLMPTSLQIITFHLGVFLWCQWVTTIRGRWHIHDATNTVQRQWGSKKKKKGSFGTWNSIPCSTVVTLAQHSTSFWKLPLSRHDFRTHFLRFPECLVVFFIWDEPSHPTPGTPWLTTPLPCPRDQMDRPGFCEEVKQLPFPNWVSPRRCSLWRPARAVLTWLVLICFVLTWAGQVL